MVNHMKKKLFILGCSAMMGVFVLTGCGSKDEEPEYQVESAQKEDSASQETMQMVKVTKVDGSTITADVGESAGQPPQGSMEPGDGGDKGGQPPEGSMEPPAQDGEKPADGEDKGEQPPQGSMEPPQGSMEPAAKGKDGKQGDMGEKEFTSSGESITFEVTDDTVISKGNGDDAETGSLEDISKDTILMVEVDDNNQATKIMIR
jgi:hypothetical protein